MRPVRASFIASAGSLMKWKVSLAGGGALVAVSVDIVNSSEQRCVIVGGESTVEGIGSGSLPTYAMQYLRTLAATQCHSYELEEG